jgi:hypothetical protein
MLKTLLRCPNCQQRIALEDARTDVPVPEQSTPRKEVFLRYTVCPKCKVDFWVTGEKLGAAAILATFFMLMFSSFYAQLFTLRILVLAAAFLLLLLQRKIVQLFIRTAHA